MKNPLLIINGLTKIWRQHGQGAGIWDVGLTLSKGEILAVAGRSGSGKTTLARLILRLVRPDAGAVIFMGEDWLALKGRRLRQSRRHMQLVFQDPLAALNPQATVARLIGDPLTIHAISPPEGRTLRVRSLMDRVGLPENLAGRRPHQISGGQRQRVAIARAIASQPQLLVLDEPVAALDPAIRAPILNLLLGLRDAGTAMLMITHDLGVVRAIANRALIMDRGRVMEQGPVEQLFAAPAHPVTRALIDAVPSFDTPAAAF